jgi:PAS domain S-box-containing protein
MLGQPVTRIIPAERLEEEAQIFARLRRGERVEHYETVRRHKDGRMVNVNDLADSGRQRAHHRSFQDRP